MQKPCSRCMVLVTCEARGYSSQDFTFFLPVGMLYFYSVIVTNQNLALNLVPLCGR
jgi:hypothetical protein